MRFKIYRLIDPRTDEVRYVGITTKSLEKRLYMHIYLARKSHHTYCSRWIQQMLNLDLQPRIELIEETTNSQREKLWIHHYITRGAHLTNITPGGDGRFGHPSPLKGRKREPFSEAHCKAIGNARRGKPRSDATRKALSEAKKGKPFSQAHKDALSKGQALRWQREREARERK